MFLMDRKIARRPAAISFVLAIPFLLAACSMRYDESFDHRTKRGYPSVATVMNDSTASSEKGDEAPMAPDNTPILFGIRYDDSIERERQEKMRQNPQDPRTTPSVRELREARATMMMEDDIFARGGNTYVRYDGSSSKPGEVRFPATAGALGLRINASRRLNAVDGVPTAITLVVYHLTDRLSLDQLSGTEGGMRKLLEGEMFDKSVVAVRQFDIQPGTQNQLELPRGEGGRYVAVVAGYNKPDPRTSLFITSYNIGTYKKKGEFRIMSDIDMYVPLPLNLCVELGESSVLVTETNKIYHNMRDSTHMIRQQKHYYQRINWELRNRRW